MIGGNMAGESAREMARTRRARAERLLRDADRYERGAEGEVESARVLSTLPAGEWRVFHDVRWPGRRYANIDHVVVGPSGVFVIDSKAWSGDIEVRAGALRQDGRRREKTVTAAVSAAEAVAELVPGLAQRSVHPVLCFVREEPVFGWSHEVMVCSTANIVTFLTSRPRVLSEAEVQEAAEALSLSLMMATVRAVAPAAPVARPSGETTWRQPLPQRRRSRRGADLRGLAAASCVVVAIAVAFQLDAFARLGDLGTRVAEQVTSRTEPIGTTVTLAAATGRPALDLTAGAPILTRSTTPGVRAHRGNQLLAVPLTVHNAGATPWASQSDVRVELVDTTGASYSNDTTFTRVAAGVGLPADFRLPVGATRLGFVVFEVPRGVAAATVRVLVGSPTQERVRWSVR